MLYQVPFENEALYLMRSCHDKKGHIEYRKGNDCLKYIKECPICIRNKAGTSVKSAIKKIIPKGPQEKCVYDSWKLSKDLQEISGYE